MAIVDNNDNFKEPSDSNSEITSWVMEKVTEWEEYRNTNFEDSWEEYYRLWRGIWAAEDKTRDSERSKLISPNLQQAVEMSVAELEEATFGKGKWYDVADDVADPQKEDMLLFRQLLNEDMNFDGIPSAMSEIFLNASLYGTGIGKIVVEEQDDFVLGAQQVTDQSQVIEAVGVPKTRISVPLISVPPEEFVIDTAATNIKEALGMAQIMDVPRHTVEAKQDSGVYKEGELGGYPDDLNLSAKGESKAQNQEGRVRVVEYHGLVPRSMLDIELADDEELVDLGVDPIDMEEDDSELVEAIVTIANDGVLLRAVANPHMMKDRAFVAFQYDTIPNRFWGRGVAEKAFNMQKAIDAELRARTDAMALTVHPMMAVDATRLPRGADMSVRPGRTLLTQGDPRTILMPFHFGQTDSSTFSQSGDLERQLQNATGVMDAATPTGMNARNSTSSGMSMMMGGSIKRSKRTMANIERFFTKPLIHKIAWRRMQFDVERYPVMDVKFTVYGTLGIMAREVEQQQLSQLLSTVPPDSPAYWMLIRSIYENGTLSNKDEMLSLVDQLLQKTLQPPQPDPMIAIKQQELQITQQEKMLSLQIELMRARTEQARVQIEASKAPSQIAKEQANAILAVSKAEATEVGTQLDAYKVAVDDMIANAPLPAQQTEVENLPEQQLQQLGQPQQPQQAPQGQLPDGL